MPLTMIGVGPHGYDFMVGHWECSETGRWSGKQPQAWELKVQRVGDGSLLQLASFKGFAGIQVQPLKYISETKTWSISEANNLGDVVFSETSQDMGQKTTWVGWELLSDSRDTLSHKIHDQDTLTYLSLDEFNDVTEQQTGARGTWETSEDSTCQRSG